MKSLLYTERCCRRCFKQIKGGDGKPPEGQTVDGKCICDKCYNEK